MSNEARMTPAPESPDAALVERLRANSMGYDEWRVQDPKDGSYCIAFSWPEVANPEREAREWLADHKARFPNSQHAHYEVACVRVRTTADKMMHEAADTITRLTAERDAARRDAERLREALTRVLDTREAEAKAWFTAENARNNFSGGAAAEEKAHLRAMHVASVAEKAARAALSAQERGNV